MVDRFIPIPDNELNRILRLSELELDYTALEGAFEDLTILATKVTGSPVSLVNIIDAHTQWTLESVGVEVQQTPREKSVCQYTIMSDGPLEIKDLRLDERFSSEEFVNHPDGFRYYIGIPLQLENGINIGSLCVLDRETRALSSQKIELLQIIAQTVVKRLKSMQQIQSLSTRFHEANLAKKKAAHDIRGPLAGIIGLSELIKEQGASANMEEVLEYISMIEKSGRSLLDLTDEILSEDQKRPVGENELNLLLLKEKLLKLYGPQARSKSIGFVVDIEPGNQMVPFSKNKLLQIAGNLISNAIKFTPGGGKVIVTVGLLLTLEEKVLEIVVTDTGRGMQEKAIQQILEGKAETTRGTIGEKGYGFGLGLVKQLVDSLGGNILIDSDPARGTSFKVSLPQRI
jgi:signal transduction histidine kinase